MGQEIFKKYHDLQNRAFCFVFFLLVLRLGALLATLLMPPSFTDHQDRDGFVDVDEWTRALAAADLDSILIDLQTAAEQERRQQEEVMRHRNAEEMKRVSS